MAPLEQTSLVQADGVDPTAQPLPRCKTMACVVALAIFLSLLGAAAAFSQQRTVAAVAAARAEAEIGQSAAIADAVAAALRLARAESLMARPRLGSAHVRSLLSEDGVAWRCTTHNASNGSSTRLVDVAARVPGVAHEALQAADVIGDPFYRFNELAYRWVALAAWNFTASFNVTADSPLIRRPELALRLSGVDTFAALLLNGVAIGSLDNAHITHDVHIPSGLLRPGANTLVVAFAPPLAESARRAAAYPYAVPHTLYHHTWSEPSHRNFARKAQSDFGWDWGPSLVPTGLTGAVELRASERGAAELAGLAIAQEHRAGGAVALRVSGWLEQPAGAPPPLATQLDAYELRLELCYPRCGEGEGAPAQRVLGVGALTPPPGTTAASAAASISAAPPLLVSSPELWWPRGYGAQPLYEVVATLCMRGGACGGALRRRVGLRRVELVQEPAPPPTRGAPNGTSFYFRINAVAIFAKGANAIPSHVFASAEASAAGVARWRYILRRAAGAHFNMVRVWGGGRYQGSPFYDACDELGLLVWQEFIFACALYPRDAAFLASVRKEVVQQTLRLAHHASVVVWGANNENEQALHWYDESRRNRDLYLVDQAKLYLETLLPAVSSADADARPIVDSSPSNGLVSSVPYVKRWGTVGAGSWGDTHYYNYVADCEDASTYPSARFVSEHGFQSFPSLSQYASVSVEEDWSRDSAFSDFRMRHPEGDAQALAMMRRHFRVPPARSSGARSQARLFDDWLWLSQAQQARCYETAFSRWRRDRSSDAKTMGILYWQLNAIWQGPDWSTLEYDGSPRLSHHAVKRSFAPLLLSTTAALPPLPPPRIPPEGVAILSGGDAGARVVGCAFPGDEGKRVISDEQMMAAGLRAVDVAPQCCSSAAGTRGCYRKIGGELQGRCLAEEELLGGVSYAEAAAFCAGVGLELCDRGCLGAGCNLDAAPVWSRLPCPTQPTGGSAAEPVVSAATDPPVRVHAHLTSDLRLAVEGTLSVEAFKWERTSPLSTAILHVGVGAAASIEVWSQDVTSMLKGAPRSEAFLRLTFAPDASSAAALVAAGQSGPGLDPAEPLLVAYQWLTQLKDASLPLATPTLASLAKTAPAMARLGLTTDKTAVLVTAECDAIDGAFSDGALTLLGGAPPLYLDFEAKRDFDVEELRRCLRLRSLRDTWD